MKTRIKALPISGDYIISWVDENGSHYRLTGDKNSVEYALEAIEFYEGNRDVKIQKVGDTKKS